ncbi:MAG: hypothetical protein DRI90_15870 [Deltaproteobacteria bacterium]|nr:MAG: hypothetical protein DRI90_15870 [Deltaproteobacteria bacterium]
MIEFLRAGGFGMGVVVVVGGITLVTAIMFAHQPDERRMALIRAFTAASLFSVLTAVSSNLATVMVHVPQNPKFADSHDFAKIIMIGIGESLTPAIMGCAILTVTWVIAAVGMRRLSERLSELSGAALASA